MDGSRSTLQQVANEPQNMQHAELSEAEAADKKELEQKQREAWEAAQAQAQQPGPPCRPPSRGPAVLADPTLADGQGRPGDLCGQSSEYYGRATRPRDEVRPTSRGKWAPAPKVKNEVEAMRVGNQKDTKRIEEGLGELDGWMRKLEVGGNAPQTERVMMDILHRIQQLVNKPTEGASPQRSGTPASTPMHIVFGGWHEWCKRETIENQCEDLMRSLPADIRSLIQRPYSPRPVANSAKAQGRPRELAKAQLALQKWLDVNWKTLQKYAQGPRWCAIERLPEAGRRRRIVRDACDIVRSRPEGIDMDDATGDITKGGVVVAKWNRGRTCWTPTAAWTAVIPTPWQDLEGVLQKLV